MILSELERYNLSPSEFIQKHMFSSLSLNKSYIGLHLLSKKEIELIHSELLIQRYHVNYIEILKIKNNVNLYEIKIHEEKYECIIQ
jgi:hypothetical protein